MAAEMTVANALADGFETHPDGDHTAGMVLGITVPGERKSVPSHGRTRKRRLVVAERPATGDLPAGFGFQVEEHGYFTPPTAATPCPPLILERCQPVEITVVNRLQAPTTVHWLGMELESYYDGVAGWGALGSEVTPVIASGKSFRVRFTPPREGTFIYHTHLQGRQFSGGLYGALIVADSRSKFDPTHEETIIVSRAGPGVSQGPVLFNGSFKPPLLHWSVGQRYRLRFINMTAFDGVAVALRQSDRQLQWRAMAKDGALLTPEQRILKPARQATMTGETFDFEYEPKEPGSLQLEISKRNVNNVVRQMEGK